AVVELQQVLRKWQLEQEAIRAVLIEHRLAPAEDHDRRQRGECELRGGAEEKCSGHQARDTKRDGTRRCGGLDTRSGFAHGIVCSGSCAGDTLAMFFTTLRDAPDRADSNRGRRL